MTQQKHCFDVTSVLGEKPHEIVFGHFGTNLVFCAASKTVVQPRQELVAAMWEVKNGLHLSNTVTMCAISCSKLAYTDLIESLWLLFGSSNTNLKKIKLERHSFVAKPESEFWSFVSARGLQNVVVKSRLSADMEKHIATEREQLRGQSRG